MNVVVTATAGIDSTVLLYRYAATGWKVWPYFVDYGQAVAASVQSCVGRHVVEINKRWPNSCQDLFVQRLTFPANMVVSPHLFSSGYKPYDIGDVEKADDDASRQRIGWINCRNLFILSMAAAYASSHGCDLATGHEWSGSSEDEGPTIPDNRSAFLEALDEALSHSLHVPVTWHTPYLAEQMTKTRIVQQARHLGVNLRDTISCDYYPACGKCGKCQRVEALKIGE